MIKEDVIRNFKTHCLNTRLKDRLTQYATQYQRLIIEVFINDAYKTRILENRILVFHLDNMVNDIPITETESKELFLFFFTNGLFTEDQDEEIRKM